MGADESEECIGKGEYQEYVESRGMDAFQYRMASLHQALNSCKELCQGFCMGIWEEGEI